ncbi:MAG: translation elongation factor Ts [Chloroflexi bacterium]|nr:translation elongation factor Ts [Chloroflexota bacterium]
MATITAEAVRELRERTGAGMMDCKRALEEAGGDVDKAIELLRERGLAAAARKAGREARDGLVASYIHTGGRVGVLIEVNCETDFVARNEQFQGLVRNLALQVAATYPRWVAIEDVPADELEAKRAEILGAPDVQGKPENVRDSIIAGRLQKWYSEPGGVLLEQPFRDTEQRVGELVTDAIAKLGENIRVRRFARYALGEDL